MKLSLLALTLACTSAFAQNEAAYGAIAADGASSFAGVAAGGVEAGLLGWWGLPLRIGAVAYASKLPPEEGVPVIRAVTQVSVGAALSNLIAGPVGIVVGIGLWLKDKPERDFYELCARIKTPEQRCVYKEPT